MVEAQNLYFDYNVKAAMTTVLLQASLLKNRMDIFIHNRFEEYISSSWVFAAVVQCTSSAFGGERRRKF
jgi:hypothetical protein